MVDVHFHILASHNASSQNEYLDMLILEVVTTKGCELPAATVDHSDHYISSGLGPLLLKYWQDLSNVSSSI